MKQLSKEQTDKGYIVRRGNSDKKEVLSRIQNELRINKFDTPFLIDDVNDLIVLSWVGLFIAPFIAILVVKKSDYISQLNGGYGFFREVIDNSLISKIMIHIYLFNL